jgi:peroxidase
MRKNMDVLPLRQMLSVSHSATSPKSKKRAKPRSHLLSEGIVCFLSLTALSAAASDLRGHPTPQVSLLSEFRPIGGAGNNLHFYWLNAIPGSPEIALTPLNFAPGSKDGLVNGPTNPRTISNVISGGTGAHGQNGQTTDPQLSAWLYVFGQFVDHDLDLEETPLSNPQINIIIPPNDPNPKAGTMIAMNRDTRSPITNTIINTTAGYLDLSQLYGSDPAIAASLRRADGTLATSDNGLALPVVNGLFVTGDPRVMENPELTALTILFMREHNFWVATLKSQHPKWTGDQLYNMAKAINTAEYQNIVYTEYLPALIGPVLKPYRGYNPMVNSQVTQEFSTAAFRVGHSQVSDTQEGIDANGNPVFTESLAASFANTAMDDEDNGIDALIRALGTDFSQATDVYVVSALRNLLVAGLVGGGVDLLDLIAIDIQREKDVGLGTLNQTRTALGLNPYSSIKQLTSDPVLAQALQKIYGGIDQIDLFIGGLAESHAPGANVGQTFQAIISEQFEALRAGDRFFWQNEGFDPATALMISDTTLANIIQRNTATPNLQANVFIQSALPTHQQPHAAMPAVLNASGHKRPFFLDDGQ